MWKKLTQELPEINKNVFILNKKKDNLIIARLVVFTKEIKLEKCELEEGDIFWEHEGQGRNPQKRRPRGFYTTKEIYPYWMTIKEMLELSFGTVEEKNRFQMMDLT